MLCVQSRPNASVQGRLRSGGAWRRWPFAGHWASSQANGAQMASREGLRCQIRAPREMVVCHAFGHGESTFSPFFLRSSRFFPGKNHWRLRTQLGKPRCRDPQKHQCRDQLTTKTPNACTRKTPLPRPQKPQCLHSKTPLPQPKKHQCLHSRTPLPAHPTWPRPNAYTREFRKLTCVGTGRGHVGCAGNGVFARRHWCFCGRGIGVFGCRHWGF